MTLQIKLDSQNENTDLFHTDMLSHFLFLWLLFLQVGNSINGWSDRAYSKLMVPKPGVSLQDVDQLHLYSDSPDLYKQELLLGSSLHRSPEPNKSRKCIQSSNASPEAPATEEGSHDPIIKVIEVKQVGDEVELSYTGETLTLDKALQLGLIPDSVCRDIIKGQQGQGTASPSGWEDEPCQVNRLIIECLRRRKSSTVERDVHTLRSGQDHDQEVLTRGVGSGPYGNSIDALIDGEKSLVVDAAVQCDLMNSNSTLTVFHNQQHFIGLVVPPTGEIQTSFQDHRAQSCDSESSSTIIRKWWRIEAFYIPEYAEVLGVSEAVRQGLIDQYTAEVLMSMEIPKDLPDVDDLEHKFSSWLMYKKLMVDGCYHAADCLEVDEVPSPTEFELLFISHLMINSYTDPKRGSRVLILDKQLNKMLKIFLEDPSERVVTSWSGSIGRVAETTDVEMPLHIEEEPEERGHSPPRHFVSSVNGGMSFHDKTLLSRDRAATQQSFADGDINMVGKDETTCRRSKNGMPIDPMEGLYGNNLQRSPGTPDKQTLPYFDPDAIFQNSGGPDDFEADLLHLEEGDQTQGVDPATAQTEEESVGRTVLEASLSNSPTGGRSASKLFESHLDCHESFQSDDEEMISALKQVALDGFGSSTFTLSMTKRQSVSRSGCTISISESLEYGVVEDDGDVDSRGPSGVYHPDGDRNPFDVDDEDFNIIYIDGDENDQQSTEREVTVVELNLTDEVVSGGGRANVEEYLRRYHQSWGRMMPESSCPDEASMDPDDADVYSVWVGSTIQDGAGPGSQALFTTSASSSASDSPFAPANEFFTRGELSRAESDTASSHCNVLSGKNAVNSKPARPDYTSAVLGEAIVPAGGNDGFYGNGNTNRDTSPRNTAGLESGSDIEAGWRALAAERLQEPHTASDEVTTGNQYTPGYPHAGDSELSDTREVLKEMLVDKDLTGSQCDAVTSVELGRGIVFPQRTHESSLSIPTDIKSISLSENTTTEDEKNTFTDRTEHFDSILRFRPDALLADQQLPSEDAEDVQTVSDQTNLSHFLPRSCIMSDPSSAALLDSSDTVNQTAEGANIIVLPRGSDTRNADPFTATPGPFEACSYGKGDGWTGLHYGTMAEVELGRENVCTQRQHKNSLNLPTDLKPVSLPGNTATEDEQKALRDREAGETGSELSQSIAGFTFGADPSPADQQLPSDDFRHSQTLSLERPQRQHENSLSSHTNMKPASSLGNKATSNEQNTLTDKAAVEMSSGQSEYIAGMILRADDSPADQQLPADDVEYLQTLSSPVLLGSSITCDVSSSALPEVSDAVSQTPEWLNASVLLKEHNNGNTDSLTAAPQPSEACSYFNDSTGLQPNAMLDVELSTGECSPVWQHENTLNLPTGLKSASICENSPTMNKCKTLTDKKTMETSSQQAESSESLGISADALPFDHHSTPDDSKHLQTVSNQTNVCNVLPDSYIVPETSSLALPELSDFLNQTPEGDNTIVLQKEHNTHNSDSITAPPRTSKVCSHIKDDTHADDSELNDNREAPEAELVDEDLMGSLCAAMADVHIARRQDSPERQHENIEDISDDKEPVSYNEQVSIEGNRASKEKLNNFTDKKTMKMSSEPESIGRFAGDASPPAQQFPTDDAKHPQTLYHQTDVSHVLPISCNISAASPAVLTEASKVVNQVLGEVCASVFQKEHSIGSGDHFTTPLRPLKEAVRDIVGIETAFSQADDLELCNIRAIPKAALQGEDMTGSQRGIVEWAAVDVSPERQHENILNIPVNMEPLSLPGHQATGEVQSTFTERTAVIMSSEELETIARCGANASPADQQLPKVDIEHVQTLSYQADVSNVLPESCQKSVVSPSAGSELFDCTKQTEEVVHSAELLKEYNHESADSFRAPLQPIETCSHNKSENLTGLPHGLNHAPERQNESSSNIPTDTESISSHGNTTTRHEHNTSPNSIAVEASSGQLESAVDPMIRGDASSANQHVHAKDSEHLEIDVSRVLPGSCIMSISSPLAEVSFFANQTKQEDNKIVLQKENDTVGTNFVTALLQSSKASSNDKDDTHSEDSELSSTREAPEAALVNDDLTGHHSAALTNIALNTEDVFIKTKHENIVNIPTDMNLDTLSENTTSDEQDTLINRTSLQMSSEQLGSIVRFGAAASATDQVLPAVGGEHLHKVSNQTDISKVLLRSSIMSDTSSAALPDIFDAVNQTPQGVNTSVLQKAHSTESAGPLTALTQPSEVCSNNKGMDSRGFQLGTVIDVELSKGDVFLERQHENSVKLPTDAKSASLSENVPTREELETFTDKEAVETSSQQAESNEGLRFRSDGSPADHHSTPEDSKDLQTVSDQTDVCKVLPESYIVSDTSPIFREAPEAALVDKDLTCSQHVAVTDVDMATGDLSPEVQHKKIVDNSDDMESVLSGNKATGEEQNNFTDKRAMQSSEPESVGRFGSDASPPAQQLPLDDAKHIQTLSHQTNVSNVLPISCNMSAASPLPEALSEASEAVNQTSENIIHLQKEHDTTTAQECFRSHHQDLLVQNVQDSVPPMQEDRIADEAENSNAPNIQLQLLRVLKTVSTSQDLSMLQEVMESLSAALGGPVQEEQQRHTLDIIQEEDDEGQTEKELCHAAASPSQSPTASVAVMRVKKVCLILFDGCNTKLSCLTLLLYLLKSVFCLSSVHCAELFGVCWKAAGP